MEKINEIIGLIFSADGQALSDDDTPKTVEAWDSVTHILALTALEDELKIKFSDEEMEHINSIGDIRRKASEKMGASA